MCNAIGCTCILCLVFRRIKAYLPEGKTTYRKGGEPEATKLNQEKLKSLELEQQASGGIMEFEIIYLLFSFIGH